MYLPKRHLEKVLGICISFLISCGPGVTIEVLLDRHVEAMGGLNKWNELKSYRINSKRSKGWEVTNLALKPNHFQLIFKGGMGEVVKSYDGQHGWLTRNGSYEAMRKGEAIEMDEEAVFYEELMRARENGHLVVLEGKEALGDAVCFKVKMIKSDTDTQWYWVNATTYLIEQTAEFSEDQAHDGIFYKTKFSNYKAVDGYLFPFRFQLIPGEKAPIDFEIIDIQLNVPLSPEDFRYLPTTTSNCIAYLQDIHADNFLPSFTFVQETYRYREGGLVDTSIWYEAIQYPDKFRIDFGEPSEGNAVLYRSDSLYVFRNGEIKRAERQPQEFLLLEGGLHFYSLDSVLRRLGVFGIDTSVFNQAIFRGRPVYIIGAAPDQLDCPQVWLDAERHYIVRRITEQNDGNMYDVVYSKHREMGGHWIEGWVDFKTIDGKLIQAEKYQDITLEKSVPERFFSPEHVGKAHWHH
jgi:hypothetical protein